MILCESLAQTCALADRAYVFFDFDGTLGNTVDAIRSTARAVLLEHGLTPEEVGDVNRLIGPPFPNAYMQVYGFSLAEAQAVTERYREIYLSLGPESYKPYPGIPELLRDLVAAGKHPVLVTSKREAMARDMAADHGLMDYIEHVTGQLDPDHASKLELIERALGELSLGRESAVMVGDRHQDGEGARLAGVPCIGAGWGAGSVEELLAESVTAVATTVDSLRQILLPS